MALSGKASAGPVSGKVCGSPSEVQLPLKSPLPSLSEETLLSAPPPTIGTTVASTDRCSCSTLLSTLAARTRGSPVPLKCNPRFIMPNSIQKSARAFLIKTSPLSLAFIYQYFRCTDDPQSDNHHSSRKEQDREEFVQFSYKLLGFFILLVQFSLSLSQC